MQGDEKVYEHRGRNGDGLLAQRPVFCMQCCECPLSSGGNRAGNARREFFRLGRSLRLLDAFNEGGTRFADFRSTVVQDLRCLMRCGIRLQLGSIQNIHVHGCARLLVLEDKLGFQILSGHAWLVIRDRRTRPHGTARFGYRVLLFKHIGGRLEHRRRHLSAIAAVLSRHGAAGLAHAPFLHLRRRFAVAPAFRSRAGSTA